MKLQAAQCLSHVLRIYAPNTPYTTKVLQVAEPHDALLLTNSPARVLPTYLHNAYLYLQDVFALFLWVFRRLEDARISFNSPLHLHPGCDQPGKS